MNRKLSVVISLVAACVAVSMLPSIALAVTRDVALVRGQAWVNHIQSVDAKTGAKVTGVPYSQSRWASEDGTLIPTSTTNASSVGYRTDCSGFASLCWGLTDAAGHPYSTSTSEMGATGSKKFVQIAKAQLQPGDALLKSTVWGASVGHVIIFCGWVDATQTSYWCMEQTTSSSHNGTIYHTRPYGEAYYRPYRYLGLEDMYSDVEMNFSAADAYVAAASAAATSYPGTGTVPTVVIANPKQWGDQVTAASLAGAVQGPVLLTASNSLPASTSAEIARLKPQRVFVLGSAANITPATAAQIAALGTSVARINGKNSFVVAANALATTIGQAKASGRRIDTVYIANGDATDEALSIAPLLTRTSRPLLFVHPKSVPDIVLAKLKASKIKKVVILGGTKSVSAAVEKKLKKAGYKITRIAGADRYKTSLAIANYTLSLNLGFTWKQMGVTAPSATMDALAWSSANGVMGCVLTLTPSSTLDANVRRTAAAHRVEIGKAVVFGGSGGLSKDVRKALAVALRGQ